MSSRSASSTRLQGEALSLFCLENKMKNEEEEEKEEGKAEGKGRREE